LNPQHFVLIGTYTQGPSLEPDGGELGRTKGIHVYRTDDQFRLLEPCQSVQASRNPSFVSMHPNGRFVYAVNECEPEVSESTGLRSGTVSAFTFNANSGALEPLNTQSSHGLDPCHLCMDRSGRYVIVANYSGGTLCVLPILEDGSLGAACEVVEHQGSSVHAQQTGPHPHAVVLDPSNQFLFVPDLGLDKLMVYRFDAATGKLTPNAHPGLSTSPGSGPRQLALSPDGDFAYVINELNSSINTYRFESDLGRLTELQTLSTLPPDFAGPNTGADIRVSPDRRFLYGSNRGHDSIVIYAIQSDGRLTLVGHQSTRGSSPRCFSISPTGATLLVANQGSDTVVEFEIDPITGRLSATGGALSIPVPVCVQYVRVSSNQVQARGQP
jgi:6-phosphogluconolactonase